MKKICVIINGYGVPKDIFKDLNYNSYLTQIFNYLFTHFRNQPITIISAGGPTDFFKPYKRTEAQEIGKWLKTKIKTAGLKLWTVKLVAT